MNAVTGPGPLAFARGLVAIAWLTLPVAGFYALFATWYGDCFTEPCPRVSTIDKVVYGLDVIAWVVVGIVGLSPLGRPVRSSFVVIVVLGIWFVAQCVAGLLGARGFINFWLVAPAGLALALAGVAGLQSLRPASPPWSDTTEGLGVAIGFGLYAVPAVVAFGISALVAGNVLATLLTISLVASIVAIVVIFRQRT